MITKSDFPKTCDPKSFENTLYAHWEEKGLFKPQNSSTWKTFYIPMPPPNVTWKLHLGHAIMTTLEDIMVRYHRMKWDSTLWVPWTDHAWISTQAKVEEKLVKIWKTKHNISREEFFDECKIWKDEYGDIIVDQLKQTWASADWSKQRFTLDEDLNVQVRKAFVSLYNKWLIYKWEYMVNYDPVLNTVVSDQEVIYREEKWHLYYITYFVAWSDNEIIVATTRPETLLWDVAVAVNPKDKRYKKMLKAGKKLILPILNKEIPLIGDESVEMDFWTGAVKITPAHDASDFAMAKKHNLPLDNIVIDKTWKMTKVAGIFAWQDFLTARSNIVELLKSKWNLVKIEAHNSKVAYGERSGAKLETIISNQWFVKIEPIVKKVIIWYKKKDFEIIPKRYSSVFEDWIYNLRDWCISRQLIWWHRIPVWYDEAGTAYCAENEIEAQKQAWSWTKLTQDSDVLDTWFSSALWPFSVLDYKIGEKKQSELFNQFYPAQVLETGHDIIFFWVIRMLLFWYEFTNQTPFKTIYLHWLVRDKEGRKMSKSLWNGIDPLDMIDLYWTDALRLSLSIWNTAWNDLKFDEETVKNNSLFINKLWNASRFVSVNLTKDFWSMDESIIENIEKTLESNYNSLLLHEKWILSKLSYVSELVSESMEKYNFSEAWIELQAFTKNDFCDYYIEEFKLTKQTSIYSEEVIVYTINKLLKLLHPYIPFASEEIFKKLGFDGDLIVAKWWNVSLKRNIEAEKQKEVIIETVKEIRRIRAENNIAPNKTIWLKIFSKASYIESIKQNLTLIAWLVKAENFELLEKKINDNNLVYSVLKSGVEIYVDVSSWLDIEKEIERLKEQLTDTKEYIALLDKKLLNESFVRNAPASLVKAEMEKKNLALTKLQKLEEKLNNIKK